jgi:hypothetical protein
MEWQEMAENGSENDDGELSLILALASGKSVRDAAQASGVSQRTIYRRLDDPAFSSQVQSVRGDMIQQALGRMADGMAEAADVLRGLLKAKGESIRLSAARSLLDLGVKMRTAVDTEARLQALESQLVQEKRTKP